jgi:tetraprenyl-beta-curcumene synthase
LTPGQLWALAGAATRELLGGLHAVSRELKRWRRYAQTIPEAAIRADALDVFDRKRTHIYGAALFWTLPRQRNYNLLRLLVAYELIWDLLDNLSESAARAGQTDGRPLHLAIAEAIDPRGPISDYYSRHPWRDDGGYLRRLVEACRQECATLPSYPLVCEVALAEAHRAQVLALNHDPDAPHRDAELKRWVHEQCLSERQASWWELSGAASAPLTIHALLALAAQPSCTKSELDRTHAAYCPWLSATTTMLDSYVDQIEDAESGDHSYIAHYPDDDSALRAVQALVARSLVEVRSLPDGHKHAVIAAAMIAMYLSKDTARTAQLRAGSNAFIRAGGSLTRLMHPTLRLWRAVYGQSSA